MSRGLGTVQRTLLDALAQGEETWVERRELWFDLKYLGLGGPDAPRAVRVSARRAAHLLAGRGLVELGYVREWAPARAARFRTDDSGARITLVLRRPLTVEEFKDSIQLLSRRAFSERNGYSRPGSGLSIAHFNTPEASSCRAFVAWHSSPGDTEGVYVDDPSWIVQRPANAEGTATVPAK